MSTSELSTSAVIDRDGGVHAASPTPDTVALLSAVATVLRDTIGRFGDISGEVTETVLTRGDSADSGLIVKLQDFDRLQQEFCALSDVFSQCLEMWSGSTAGARSQHDPVAAVTLAGLKNRLSNCVRSEVILMGAQPKVDDRDIF
jgi:hypothetical protein